MQGKDQPSGSSWEEMISALRPGNSGNEQAVHKPLLILMLLARAQQGAPNEVRFQDIEGPLEDAIRQFGAAKTPGGPELPFWHLKNDGFWIVDDEDSIPRRKAGDRATRTGLRKRNAKGYIPPGLWQELTDTPGLIDKLARHLLEAFWPPTSHAAILQHVGLQLSSSDNSSPR